MNQDQDKGAKPCMATIADLSCDEQGVLITLSCGHVKRCYPFAGRTVAEELVRLQTEPGAHIVGKTRLRCWESHT